MTTRELVNSLPREHKHTIETISNLIAQELRRNNEAGANLERCRLRGYLTCMKDAGMLSDYGFRALSLWYITERVKHIINNPEKIQITYQHETGSGTWVEYACIVDSREEAETVCQDIESRPDEYILIDVTRID